MTTENATENEVRTVIDAWAVSLDETSYYQIDRADAPFIAAIHGVYVFDRNQATHCCELTPSYDLIYLYTCIHITLDTTDEKREELDQKYGHEGCEDIYVHCHTIDALITKGDRWKVRQYGDVAKHRREEDGTAEEMHAKEMDSIREDLCGNCP